MSLELYRKHRPRKLSQVVGQATAVKTVERMLAKDAFPHATVFSGPSGCGKTTLARIVRKKLGCHPQDFDEINAAAERGIDMVRDIRMRMGLAPIGGNCRVYLIDEAQKLTSDAQSSLLKMLEDTPNHVYFMLATTDPHKLLPTIRTRCTEIRVSLIPDKEMLSVLADVCAEEKTEISKAVLSAVAEKAEGSARKALVLLGQVIGLESDEERLLAISKADMKAQAIQLARLLINPRCEWKAVVKILDSLEEDPESVRRMMLGYAASVLKRGGHPGITKRALLLIDLFKDNFFDSGNAGLVACCYAVSSER